MESFVPIAALLMGLFGGVHCVAMCGGVVGVLCAGLPSKVRASPLRQLPYSLAYNAGRVGSYALGGLLAGAFGGLVSAAAPVHVVQLVLRVIAGAMMLGLGLQLAGILRMVGALERLGAPLWRRIEPLARRALPVRSPLGALVLGSLWGWLPCGMVYAAMALAMTSGSAARGALTMAAFGLGTLPTLLAMGALASGLARASRKRVVRQGAGLLIAAFGALSLLGTLGPGWFRPPVPGFPGQNGHHCHCH